MKLEQHCHNGHIGLTFDDGVTQWTRRIVDQLVEAKQYATFCINLNNYMCNYDEEALDVLRYAVSKRMTLCNHGAGHAHMAELSADQIREQIKQVNRFTWQTMRLKPRYFRFPYGESNALAEKIVREEGMEILNWSIDSEDSTGADKATILKHFQDLTKGVSKDIILIHGNTDEFVNDTLPAILGILKEKKMKSSGMAKCLKRGSYEDGYLKYQFTSRPRQDNWNW